MRNFFQPTASNMQDNFEAPDPELLAEDDLDGMMEASQAMDYDYETSNDEPIDGEEEDDERWEDERSEEGQAKELRTVMKAVSLTISHTKNDKNATYRCSRFAKQLRRINKNSCRVR